MLNKRDFLLGSLTAAGFAGTSPAWALDPPVRIPFLIVNDRMIVTAMLGGKGPFRFMIDTGLAVNVISEVVAAQLGLEQIQDQAFDKTYRAHDFILSDDYKLPQVVFIGVEKPLADTIDGALPAGFMMGVPSEVDFEAGEIRLYLNDIPRFSPYTDIPGYTRLTAYEHAKQVYAKVQLAGDSFNCLVQTGFNQSLYLSAAYVRKHNLWDKFPQYHDNLAADKSVSTRLVRMKPLVIGGFDFGEVTVTLCNPKIADGYEDWREPGLIGLDLLRQMNLAFPLYGGVEFKPNRFFTPNGGHI